VTCCLKVDIVVAKKISVMKMGPSRIMLFRLVQDITDVKCAVVFFLNMKDLKEHVCLKEDEHV
jgi:hypothetical protein